MKHPLKLSSVKQWGLSSNGRLLALLILAVTIAWSFYVYRLALIALPSGDHWIFMDERMFAPDNWHFVLNSLSHTRARHILDSDRFLFRPLSTGLLAVLDILLRSKLEWLGAISLFWHAATAFCAYLLIAPVLGRKRALVVLGLVATQYAGKDLVLWRHISPYLLSLFFLSLGLLGFSSTLRTRSRGAIWILSTFSLLLASLFHEVVAAFTLIYGVTWLALSLFSRGVRVNGWTAGQIGAAFSIPGAVCWSLNLLDWLIYSQVTSQAGGGLPSGGLGMDLLKNIPLAGGFFLTGALLPWQVHFSSAAFGKPFWNFSPALERAFPVEGIFLLLFLAGCFGISALAILRRRAGSRELLLNALAVCFGTLLIAFASTRVEVQGAEYMKISPYYLYFGSFFLFPLFGLALPARLLSRSGAGPKRVRGLALLGALVYIHANYRLVQRSLAPAAPERRGMAGSLNEVTAALRKNPQYCFSGALSDLFSAYVPSKMLYYQSCLRRSGIPVYGARLAEGGFSLSRLARGDDPVPLHLPPPTKVAPGIFRSLTATARPGHELVADLPENFRGSWVVAFKDDENFLLVTIQDRLVAPRLMRRGKLEWLLEHQSLPLILGSSGPIRLTLSQRGDDALLFDGERVLEELHGIGPLSGRTGIAGPRAEGRLFERESTRRATPVISLSFGPPRARKS